MTRILLVDDDRELCELLSELLRLEGFEINIEHDGPSGLTAALKSDFNLVLLDVMLPGLGGFEVLKRLRSESELPVLMLTARGDDTERVLGLEYGADDYLPKPFNDRELVARIRAILRRTEHSAGGPSLIRDHGLELNTGTLEAVCYERRLELTGTEFRLLELFLRQPGELLSKDALYRQVLGRRPVPFDRSLDVHISNLRKKLPPREDGLERLKTLRGKGYIWLK